MRTQEIQRLDRLQAKRPSSSWKPAPSRYCRDCGKIYEWCKCPGKALANPPVLPAPTPEQWHLTIGEGVGPVLSATDVLHLRASRTLREGTDLDVCPRCGYDLECQCFNLYRQGGRAVHAPTCTKVIALRNNKVVECNCSPRYV